MNSSNASNSTQCAFLETNALLVTQTTYVAYYILMPLRFFISVPNQILTVAALRRQAKLESSYSYQIFLATSKIIEVCEFSIYVSLKYFLAGMPGGGPGLEWFMESYFLMIIASKVFLLTHATATFMPLLFSSAMAVDRAFALFKPFVYRLLNKKRHQRVAIVLCVIISGMLSIDYSVRYTLSETDRGTYSAIANPYYAQAQWTPVFGYARTIVRILNMVVLVISSLISIELYRKRVKKVAKLTQGSLDEQKKEEKRKKHERTLFVLTMFQIPFVVFNTNILACYSLGAFVKPTFSSCEGVLVLAISDISIEITDMVEFYIILAVSAEFRRMVRAVVPWSKKNGATV